MEAKNVIHDSHLLSMLDLAKELVDRGNREQAKTVLISLYGETMIEAYGTARRPKNIPNQIVSLTERQYEDLKRLYEAFLKEKSNPKQAEHIIQSIKRRFNVILPYTKTKKNVGKVLPVVAKRAKIRSGEKQITASAGEKLNKPVRFARPQVRGYEKRLVDEAKSKLYSTGEAAEILGVSAETVRRLCKAGRFPKATQTDGGQWRIPKEYFNVSLGKAKEAENFMHALDQKTREQLGEPNGDFREYDINIDRT